MFVVKVNPFVSDITQMRFIVERVGNSAKIVIFVQLFYRDYTAIFIEDVFWNGMMHIHVMFEFWMYVPKNVTIPFPVEFPLK